MHLVFERSNGRFKSNCNVLALAWAPYYDEQTFRSALLDYHQRQLVELTGSIASNSQHHLEEPRSGRASAPLGRAHRHHQQARSARDDDRRRGSQVLPARGNQSSQNNNQPLTRYLNARLQEFSRRHGGHAEPATGSSKTNPEIAGELDARFGLLEDFGWLAVGNVGKMVGITLSSVVQPECPSKPVRTNHSNHPPTTGDLINFTAELTSTSAAPVDHQHSSLLDAPLGEQHRKQVQRPDGDSVRANYNLRGHQDEVIIVKWNELYQKLATVDSKGNVLIWSKTNGKFAIQTPFYNRTKTVADFKWSHDGKIALICYTDSFILVGSSSGQRHWHSMLNLDDYHITSASWTPHDDQLLLGVSNGNVLLIDLFRSDLTELEISESHVRTMCWSTGELTFRCLDERESGQLAPQDEQCGSDGSSGGAPPGDMATIASMYNTVVNHRRLSRDCSVFSRYRFCSQGPTAQRAPVPLPPVNVEQRSEQQSKSVAKRQRNILALDFANNTIRLFNGGLADPKPKTIQVHLESYIMQWSASGRVLAVAGFNIHTTAPSIGYLKCKYLNAIKFYNQHGHLIHEHAMTYTRYPITALTWAHQDSRLFVATGPRIHYAKVFFGIPSLSLLAQSAIHRNTMLPEKYDVLNHKVNYQVQLAHQIWQWQNSCCPINLDRYFKSNHGELASLGCAASANQLAACNNINVFRYQLPMKLQMTVDHLFLASIRAPFDEHWSLNDIIWHVPNQEKRYYCTLVCYSSDREMTSMAQYRIGSVARHSDGQGARQDQNKIFVLYVEFQGSLIPILRARRVGFLKPEFVIFDPEDRSAKDRKYRKVSDLSQVSQMNEHLHTQRKSLRQEQVEAFYCNDNMTAMDYLAPDILQYTDPSPRTSSVGPHSIMSEAEHYYNFDIDSYSNSTRRTTAPEPSRAGQNQNECSLEFETQFKQPNQDACPVVMAGVTQHSNPYLWYMMQQQQPMKSPQLSIHRQDRCPAPRFQTSISTRSKLTENCELVRIRSNVWGTKFKVLNVGHNSTGRDRAVLGTMAYKASILHLQPRRILMNMHNMSNYCCLCSVHHHTSRRAPQAYRPRTRESTPKQASLIDSPNRSVCSSRPGWNQRKPAKVRTPEKIMLSVGDGIRIAPKPEWNQQYKLAHKYPKHSKSIASSKPELNRNHSKREDSKRSRLQYNLPSSETHQPNWNKQYVSEKRKMHLKTSTQQSNKWYERGSPSTSGCSDSKGQMSDDVLTLSLEQGDRIKVEMSSLTQLSGHDETQSTSGVESGRNSRLDEFLAENKTLKSIQTITKMIVDLSSKAGDDMTTTGRSMEEPQQLEAGPYSSSRYIAPDTPVHRPRRLPAHLQARGCGASFEQTQSAQSSPMHAPRGSQSRRRKMGKDEQPPPYDNPLPPPPLATPMRRRFSATAKRFFDTSMRMIQSASEQSASEVECEEQEPLVSRSRHMMPPDARAALKKSPLPGQFSQPQTPLRNLFRLDKMTCDIEVLRRAMMKKMKTENMNEPTGNIAKETDSSSSWSSDSLNEDFTSSSTSDDSLAGESNKEPKSSSILSNSLRDLRDFTYHLASATNVDKEAAKRRRRRRRRRRKRPLCSSSKCPCARQIKLSNRTPIWNDQSQVYQLDFDGRVTQESAKNLQIDFEGKLALQFGRLDRCTYTLDYKYPFNAVQAMSVALASLTQRLK